MAVKKWKIVADEVATFLGWLALFLAALNFFKEKK